MINDKIRISLILSLIVLSVFNCSKTKSQDYVIMTDLSGLTLYPILSKTFDSPKALYYSDLQIEWALRIDASLLFRAENGRKGVVDYYFNDELDYRILCNYHTIALEYRQYLSKEKKSPFGFYQGYFYRHYFLRDKYYNLELNQFQFTEIDKGNTFSLGYKIGYKFGERIVVDPSIGIGLAYTIGMDRLGEIIQYKDFLRRFSFPIEFKISIGYSF